ncbi:MAG TPA: arginine--tRNA ligase, partial [Candidatus Lokiarchaeia archaeon]|nr:arginine--tRNA ligase [Candidatus Lokiarchaeia archaeon]
AEQVTLNDNFAKVEANGAYLNFYVNPAVVAAETIRNIIHAGDDYGRHPATGKKIVIEFPAPNTNKPLHLGHVRNMLLGQSLTEILRAGGHTVFPVNLNNDRGVHICKSMLAYQRWGEDAEPDVKSDHYVGQWYVRFQQELEQNPELETEAQSMLALWEDGDPEIRALWQKMNTWALDGFRETFGKFEIEFVKEYFESDFYMQGKDIILKALDDGIFQKNEEGAVLAELEPYNLPNKVLLRADGTAIYMTQDIALAMLKKQDFDYDLSVFVVGNEQINHFKQLFQILKMLGIEADSYHLAYGMIKLPSGKMKSREGKSVDADDIVSEMTTLAEQEVRERYPDLDEDDIAQRASTIGMAALRYFILKYEAMRDFVFNPAETISFEGETGPYILYAYARISSIFAKAGVSREEMGDAEYSLLTHETEIALINLLGKYPDIIQEAGNMYKPHLIAHYLMDLAQTFTRFYDACPVKDAEPTVRDARLSLLVAVQIVMKNGLGLFHIHVLEKM